MGRVIYFDGNYRIVERRYDYVLANTKGKYENHGHFAKEKDCHKMIGIINKKQVPYGSYMREAALRISTDEKYKADILHKIEKDKNKPKLIRINKGLRK